MREVRKIRAVEKGSTRVGSNARCTLRRLGRTRKSFVGGNRLFGNARARSPRRRRSIEHRSRDGGPPPPPTSCRARVCAACCERVAARTVRPLQSSSSSSQHQQQQQPVRRASKGFWPRADEERTPFGPFSTRHRVLSVIIEIVSSRRASGLQRPAPFRSSSVSLRPHGQHGHSIFRSVVHLERTK